MTGAERVRGLAGGAIIAALITGSAALAFVVIGFFTNVIVSGLALVAAAICFTGIANAILRH